MIATQNGEFTIIEHNRPDENGVDKIVQNINEMFEKKYGKVVIKNEEE